MALEGQSKMTPEIHELIVNNLWIIIGQITCQHESKPDASGRIGAYYPFLPNS